MAETRRTELPEPLRNAPPEIRKIIERVLKLERDKLYQPRPHVGADILQIIKEEIR